MPNATSNVSPAQLKLATDLLENFLSTGIRPSFLSPTEFAAARADLVAAVDAGDYDNLQSAIEQARMVLRIACSECGEPIPADFSDDATVCSKSCDVYGKPRFRRIGGR